MSSSSHPNDGDDNDDNAGGSNGNYWDYVVVTSPEAANVLASAWDHSSSSSPAVVAVGKATEKILAQNNIPVSFVPSKATAETLAQELAPVVVTNAGKTGDGTKRTTEVLYPASARAQTALQDGLEARGEGFVVTRLNTYDTVTATWTEEQTALAQTVQVACFASPSSIKGWLHNTQKNGIDNNNNDDNNGTVVLAACIGITSAMACQKLGWKDEHIFYPESPGMEGWVASIHDATAMAAKLSPSSSPSSCHTSDSAAAATTTTRTPTV